MEAHKIVQIPVSSLEEERAKYMSRLIEYTKFFSEKEYNSYSSCIVGKIRVLTQILGDGPAWYKDHSAFNETYKAIH